MTRFHLLGNALRDVIESEQALLFRYAGMEDDLEQQIAEFFTQFVHCVTLDCVGDLVGFLDRVWRDRAEILREIPFTAAFRIAQSRHDGKKSVDWA